MRSSVSRPAFDWTFVLDRLSTFYGTGDWRRPYLRDHAQDPFQVLVGTILSQRTKDANTDVASARLFHRYPSAPALARATPQEIEPLIRATGFYHVKARMIRATARALLDRFGGDVPRTFDELTSLPGVGPKTANCVLVFGYGIPAIPVDTHVHRIANRLGVVRTRTPEETEARLAEVVDPKYWIPLNPLLVQHGQNLCRPRGPRCPECPIVEVCATGLALRSGRNPPRPEDRPKAGGSRGARRSRPASRAEARREPPTRPRTTGRRRPNRRRRKRALRPRAGSS
jgi:endonuclease III